MIWAGFIWWNLVLFSPPGDPSLRGGNGIPPRCVYLEEMAADLDGQDWLDMDNIEQVGCQQHALQSSIYYPHLVFLSTQ